MPASVPGFAGYQISVFRPATLTVRAPTAQGPCADESPGLASSGAPLQPMAGTGGGRVPAPPPLSEDSPPHPHRMTRVARQTRKLRMVGKCIRHLLLIVSACDGAGALSGPPPRPIREE